MPVAFFFVACLLFALIAVGYRHWRSATADPIAAATLFETRLDPPFVRPVVTRMEDGDLVVEAPVVHARLVGEILVLDVKSHSGKRAEGFELAITGFRADFLEAGAYHYHDIEGHLLFGPQGGTTDRLLARAARRHDLVLPATAGTNVQAFGVAGVVTDPGDFSVEIQAVLPSGAPLHVAYDYAQAKVHARVPASALTARENYRPLSVRLEAA